MSELLDIVNEHDEVIGQAERKEIKAQGLICRVSEVFVINNKEEVLLQWRNTSKENPHMFGSSVGGHLNAGESYDAAALREMNEELGIECTLNFISKFQDMKSKKNGQLYICYHEGPFTNWEEEAEYIEWFSITELEELIKRLPYLFTGTAKRCFKAYKKYLEETENIT